MASKISIGTLQQMLVNAKCRAENETDFIARSTARDEVRKLQSRIANRERYDAMRSLGLVKTPYGWE